MVKYFGYQLKKQINVYLADEMDIQESYYLDIQ